MKPALECHTSRLDRLVSRLQTVRVTETRGRVVQLIGLVVESEGPLAAVGDVCRIESPRHDGTSLAEVVGFRNHHMLLMPLGEIHGIHPGSQVVSTGGPLRVAVGPALKGRVIDGLGKQLDGGTPVPPDHFVGLQLAPPHPLKRQRIRQSFRTGVKAIDTFTPCGCGQRLGIFAGSGVGKSTLLGMMASQSEADVNVIALIGERGREVREFLEKDLDEQGRAKSVVVVATSNEPALARVKGAFLAMAIAEYFRDLGQNVLLMMDSLTRFAMAQREIGLAVGEPPTTRGYTPSVFSLLPQLLERAGMGEKGSITGLFTVLVEADDMNDPIADGARSILDGHIVLTRELATQSHFPAIDVLESVSRLDRDLLNAEQGKLVGEAREHLATYRRNQDLISIGAYPPGSNPAIDAAIHFQDPLRFYLRQGLGEGFTLDQSWHAFGRVMAQKPASKSPATPKPAETSMKSFRPPLQVVHTIREQKEQAAQLAYAESIRNREVARERLQVSIRQLDDAWAHTRIGRACGAPAEELQRARNWCDVLVEHRRELELALQLAEVNVDKSLRALRLAQRARETITRYQKRKLQAHVREVRRIEQKELDEAGTRLAVLGTTFASA